MASMFKVTKLYACGFFLFFAVFILTIDLENPLPLNIWQYLLMILGVLCYIVFIILNIREKNWMLIVGFTLAVIMYGYCLSLLLTPVAS